MQNKFYKYDIVELNAFLGKKWHYMIFDVNSSRGVIYYEIMGLSGMRFGGFTEDTLVFATNPNMSTWNYWVPSNAQDVPDKSKDIKTDLPEGINCPVTWKPKACTCGAHKTYGNEASFHSSWCDLYEPN